MTGINNLNVLYGLACQGYEAELLKSGLMSRLATMEVFTKADSVSRAVELVHHILQSSSLSPRDEVDCLQVLARFSQYQELSSARLELVVESFFELCLESSTFSVQEGCLLHLADLLQRDPSLSERIISVLAFLKVSGRDMSIISTTLVATSLTPVSEAAQSGIHFLLKLDNI